MTTSTTFCFSALVPARYILAVLGSVAMAIVYGLKVNLSVAMVAMLNHTAIKLASDGGHTNSTLMKFNSTNITHAPSEDSCGSDADSSGALEVIP